MAIAKVTVGTRIYYTGDNANIEDFGTVTEIQTATHYTPEIAVVMLDNGRIRKPYATMIGDTYNGSHNPRFVIAVAYDAWRNAGYEKLLKGILP